MSRIIQVLETMASDASLVKQENIISFLATAEINTEQQQAITAKDSEQLAETISDLPNIRAFVPIAPAEDDEAEGDNDEDTDTTGKLVSNFQ